MWLYAPALIVALVVTVLELTEVVALVFALSADHHTIRHGALGAAAGTGTVSALAVGAGAVLLALPLPDFLWGSAVVLAAFGVFLFRSTLKSYRRRLAPPPSGPASTSRAALQFSAGFTVGAIETTEAVIVLLALTAAGYGTSALSGALIGGVALVAAAVAVHDRIRRIKTVYLKWGATSMVFAFAVFWGGEAAGLAWPRGDVFLVVLFLAGVLAVRGGLAVFLRRDRIARPTAPG